MYSGHLQPTKGAKEVLASAPQIDFSEVKLSELYFFLFSEICIFSYSHIFEISFKRWKIGQPDNLGGAEHCVAVDLKTGKAVLIDTSCESKYQYICEV
jgi:hypothetical protein